MRDVDCAWVGDRLPEYHAGGLDAEERGALERHVAACAACAAESRVVTALRHVPVPPPPPLRWARLADEVRAATARSARRRAAWVRGAVAAALAAGLAGWWWWRGRVPDAAAPDVVAVQLAPEEWSDLAPLGAWDDEVPIEVLTWTATLPWSGGAIPEGLVFEELTADEIRWLLEEWEAT